jgi:hypothetical protein
VQKDGGHGDEPSPATRVLIASLISTTAACAGSTSTPTTTPSEVSFPLPTSGINGCAGVLFDGPIILEVREGSTVGRLQSGKVLPMLWPTGFTTTFDAPEWRVLDADGELFATSGQDIGDVMRSGTWNGWETCPTLEYLVVY